MSAIGSLGPSEQYGHNKDCYNDVESLLASGHLLSKKKPASEGGHKGICLVDVPSVNHDDI